MYLDKPIIKELNYTESEIAEVKRIMLYDPITKRKDNIKSILHNPLCCIRAQPPSKKVEYKSGVIETYCNTHFPIYEQNQGISLSDIAKKYNCEVVKSGSYFGRGKVEGYEYK